MLKKNYRKKTRKTLFSQFLRRNIEVLRRK